MERTDLLDTADWAHHEQVRRLRLMTPSEKAKLIEDTVQMGLDMSKLARKRLESERIERDS